MQFRTENHIFVSIPVNIYAKNQLKNHTEMKNLFSVDGKVVAQAEMMCAYRPVAPKTSDAGKQA